MYKTSRLLTHLAVSGIASLAFQTLAFAGDVGVSVNLNVNAPGIYGQITLGGGLPAPELLLPQPVVAVPPRVVVVSPPTPLYLHVPPGHERHWAKHCREYNACGVPVYFVSDRWYQQVYTPRHREYEGDRGEHYRDKHDRDERREDRGHGHDHDHDRGRGHDRDDHDHDRN